jgi:hypothetical protein
MSLPLALRVVALVGWALAFTVAAGASTPRLRAPGRERVSRAGIVRAGSQRPDDPRACVTPGTEHDPEYTVADAVVASTTGGHGVRHRVSSCTLPPVGGAVHKPSQSALPNRTAPRPRLTRWLVRSAFGRAPPLA